MFDDAAIAYTEMVPFATLTNMLGARLSNKE